MKPMKHRRRYAPRDNLYQSVPVPENAELNNRSPKEQNEQRIVTRIQQIQEKKASQTRRATRNDTNPNDERFHQYDRKQPQPRSVLSSQNSRISDISGEFYYDDLESDVRGQIEAEILNEQNVSTILRKVGIRKDRFPTSNSDSTAPRTNVSSLEYSSDCSLFKPTNLFSCYTNDSKTSLFGHGGGGGTASNISNSGLNEGIIAQICKMGETGYNLTFEQNRDRQSPRVKPQGGLNRQRQNSSPTREVHYEDDLKRHPVLRRQDRVQISSGEIKKDQSLDEGYNKVLEYYKIRPHHAPPEQEHAVVETTSGDSGITSNPGPRHDNHINHRRTPESLESNRAQPLNRTKPAEEMSASLTEKFLKSRSRREDPNTTWNSILLEKLRRRRNSKQMMSWRTSDRKNAVEIQSSSGSTLSPKDQKVDHHNHSEPGSPVTQRRYKSQQNPLLLHNFINRRKSRDSYPGASPDAERRCQSTEGVSRSTNTETCTHPATPPPPPAMEMYHNMWRRPPCWWGGFDPHYYHCCHPTPPQICPVASFHAVMDHIHHSAKWSQTGDHRREMDCCNCSLNRGLPRKVEPIDKEEDRPYLTNETVDSAVKSKCIETEDKGTTCEDMLHDDDEQAGQTTPMVSTSVQVSEFEEDSSGLTRKRKRRKLSRSRTKSDPLFSKPVLFGGEMSKSYPSCKYQLTRLLPRKVAAKTVVDQRNETSLVKESLLDKKESGSIVGKSCNNSQQTSFVFKTDFLILPKTRLSKLNFSSTAKKSTSSSFFNFKSLPDLGFLGKASLLNADKMAKLPKVTIEMTENCVQFREIDQTLEGLINRSQRNHPNFTTNHTRPVEQKYDLHTDDSDDTPAGPMIVLEEPLSEKSFRQEYPSDESMSYRRKQKRNKRIALHVTENDSATPSTTPSSVSPDERSSVGNMSAESSGRRNFSSVSSGISDDRNKHEEIELNIKTSSSELCSSCDIHLVNRKGQEAPYPTPETNTGSSSNALGSTDMSTRIINDVAENQPSFSDEMRRGTLNLSGEAISNDKMHESEMPLHETTFSSDSNEISSVCDSLETELTSLSSLSWEQMNDRREFRSNVSASSSRELSGIVSCSTSQSSAAPNLTNSGKLLVQDSFLSTRILIPSRDQSADSLCEREVRYRRAYSNVSLEPTTPSSPLDHRVFFADDSERRAASGKSRSVTPNICDCDDTLHRGEVPFDLKPKEELLLELVKTCDNAVKQLQVKTDEETSALAEYMICTSMSRLLQELLVDGLRARKVLPTVSPWLIIEKLTLKMGTRFVDLFREIDARYIEASVEVRLKAFLISMLNAKILDIWLVTLVENSREAISEMYAQSAALILCRTMFENLFQQLINSIQEIQVLNLMMELPGVAVSPKTVRKSIDKPDEETHDDKTEPAVVAETTKNEASPPPASPVPRKSKIPRLKIIAKATAPFLRHMLHRTAQAISGGNQSTSKETDEKAHKKDTADAESIPATPKAEEPAATNSLSGSSRNLDSRDSPKGKRKRFGSEDNLANRVVERLKRTRSNSKGLNIYRPQSAEYQYHF